MTKNIFILFTAIATLGYSQNNPIDFESGGFGASWTWTVFENDTNPPLEIIANPDPTGNNSTTVAKFTALQSGQPFAGCETMHGTDIGSFTFDTSNSIIKIWVWKSVISDVGIKFVDANSAAQPEIKVPNTLINQWEELTFDFSSRIGEFPLVKDQIVIFPDFDARTADNIIYFDNITFSDGTLDVSEFNDNSIRYYPNPVDKNWNIESVDPIIQIVLYNVLGEEINSVKPYRTNYIMNLSGLSPGIYLAKIVTVQGEKSIKLIKN